MLILGGAVDGILGEVQWGVVAPTSGLVALLVWLVRQIMSGALVPRATHLLVVEALQDANARADRLADQVDRLAGGVGTAARVIEAFPKAGGGS